MPSYPDYIDEDIAYLLGAIIARGEIIEQSDELIITIQYPYRYLQIDEVTDIPTKISVGLDSIINRFKKLGFDVTKIFDPNNPENGASLKLVTKASSIEARVIKYHLNDRLTYREFEIPNALWDARESVVREFIRGYADVAGHIRRSNRDPNGFNRVYLDVLFDNWKLPVQLCNLIMMKLNVPVSVITWAHPNIRDPSLKHKDSSSWWKKEHQIKIYAHNFISIGFYIPYKQEHLKKLAIENIEMLHNKKRPSQQERCDGIIRIRSIKESHPGENDPDLPNEIRGIHFNSYKEICRALGCKLIGSYEITRWLSGGT